MHRIFFKNDLWWLKRNEEKRCSADFNWSIPAPLGSCLYWSPSCCFFCTVFFSRMNYLNRFGNRKIVCASSLTRIKGNYWGAASIGLRTDARQTHSLIKVMGEQPSKASCGCTVCLSAHCILRLFRLNALTRSCFCRYLTCAELHWHKEIQKGLCEYMHKDLQKQGSYSSSGFPFLKAVVIVPYARLWKKVTLPASRQVLKFKHMGGPINPDGGTPVQEAHG